MAPFPSPTKTWHTTKYAAIDPTRPELSAEGKTVVVTGGGTGIGAETARSFAEAGAARIGLIGRREQPLLDTKAVIKEQFPGVEVLIASADVTDKNAVDKAFASIAGDGQIHVLVAGAAVVGSVDPVVDADPEAFLSTVDISVRGALYTAQAFARHAANDAAVVNISSNAAHFNFGPAFGAYSVAKMGIVRMWDSLASSYPQMSIVSIHPGIVDTAMNREAGGIEALGFEDHVSLPASFCVWLASPEARFVKNKFLWVNWDVNELKTRAQELESSTTLSVTLGGWPFGETDWKLQSKWTDSN